jgi:hypothetical protein
MGITWCTGHKRHGYRHNLRTLSCHLADISTAVVCSAVVVLAAQFADQFVAHFNPHWEDLDMALAIAALGALVFCCQMAVTVLGSVTLCGAIQAGSARLGEAALPTIGVACVKPGPHAAVGVYSLG